MSRAIRKLELDGPPPENRMVGYARVSTVEQRLDLQTDALKAAGVMAENLWVEKLSATKANRPQLELAIKDLRPGDTLVVWRLDRLSRSMQDLYARIDQIKAAGAGFKSLTESFDFTTATGQLILGMLAIMAAFERQLTVERTKAGMKAVSERGKRLGRTVVFNRRKQARALALVRSGKSVEAAVKTVGVSKATFYGAFKVKRKAGKVIVSRRK